MSSEEHRGLIREVAESYDPKNIIAEDAPYPGIFSEPVEEHEINGRVDLMVDIPEGKDSKIRIIEASQVSTLVPEFIQDKYIENANQLQKHASYFEDLGYDVVPHIELEPRGKLLGLKNFWESTNGVATWQTVREAIEDDDLLSEMRQKEIIVYQGESKMGNGLYTVNEEIKEYDELIGMFNRGII